MTTWAIVLWLVVGLAWNVLKLNSPTPRLDQMIVDAGLIAIWAIALIALGVVWVAGRLRRR